MRILYITYSQIGDRSFGGGMRANAIRDALLPLGTVDTIVVDGGPEYLTTPHWDDDHVRTAIISRHGFSINALIQRLKLKRWVKRIISEGSYEFIVAQRLDLATLVPTFARSTMIFDPDDFKKSAHSSASKKTHLKIFIRNWLARQIAKQSNHVWYSNPSVDQLPPTSRRSYLPNIIVAPEKARVRTEPVSNRLLMVGFFNHQPNFDGLLWFHQNVLPRLMNKYPTLQLHAVGQIDIARKHELPNVIFRGFVDDLTKEYDDASLVIAPINSGGGTQIKVLDALAHCRPLIVSEFAHRGFSKDLIDGSHLLVAETVDQWIAKCEWALNNYNKALALALSGEKVVRNRYGPRQLEIIVSKTFKSINPVVRPNLR